MISAPSLVPPSRSYSDSHSPTGRDTLPHSADLGDTHTQDRGAPLPGPDHGALAQLLLRPLLHTLPTPGEFPFLPLRAPGTKKFSYNSL